MRFNMTRFPEQTPIAGPKGRQDIVGSARVNHDLREYQNRVRMLADQRSLLEHKYPDQWVALTSNWTIVAAPTIREMMEKLNRKRLTGNGAAVKFMDTTHRRMILSSMAGSLSGYSCRGEDQRLEPHVELDVSCSVSAVLVDSLKVHMTVPVTVSVQDDQRRGRGRPRITGVEVHPDRIIRHKTNLTPAD